MSEYYATDKETNYIIRKLEYEDYNRGFLELLEQLTTVNAMSINKIDFNLQVKELNKNPGHLIIVMIDKNQIIATGCIFIERKFIHTMGKVGHIEDVVVHKNYRNKGLGKEIINTLVEFARRIECYKVILDCSEENISFYENCGFEKKGIEMSKYF